MSYVVLARKYRPATLSELAGQGHIERALSNAISMNRVPHALLFCGARGTGKTSTARIVAKMLNCITGPTATPCGTCAACREITAGNCMDVHELDAASNRGIEEIRELRSGVGYAPARDRSKIYIIDEAHMLTEHAANAFLKTLEEPPPHVVFILATTDPQKLPVTIRSRCQRYDFRRVRAAEVVKRLAWICDQEHIEADPAGLYLVAREGDGSMRDSLSVLDQVIAFGGNSLDEATVASLLGVADRNRTAKLMQALLEKDATGALQGVAAANDHGMDLKTFARTLATEARDVLITSLAGPKARDLIDRAESELQALKKLGEMSSVDELERLTHVLLELAEQVARARHPRLVMEMGLVRLCRAASLVNVADLVLRVERLLEAGPRIKGPSGGSPGGGSPGGSGGGGGIIRQGSPMPTTVQPGARPPLRAVTNADREAWVTALREQLKQPALATLLRGCIVKSGTKGMAVLALGAEFTTQQMRSAETLASLTASLALVIPGDWQVEIGPVDPRAKEESLAGIEAAKGRKAIEDANKKIEGNPAVRSVIEAFGGSLSEMVPYTAPAITIDVTETVH